MGSGVEVNDDNFQKYYQVTSNENAQALIESENPVLRGTEFQEIYAWTEQPTYEQASNSGARYLDTVIEFETSASFIWDISMDDKSLWSIARVSARPGPISISNVIEVGNKKVVAILKKIVLKNFSVGGTCDLFHYGIVQDCLQKNNFEFCVGNVYGVIGEFGDGGAALSCGLTGNTDFYEGKIYIDDKEETINHLVKKSWYIGYDLYGSQKLFKRKTIREQIEAGVRVTHCDLSAETIQNMFHVSEERVGRNIKRVSGERWKASIAIGYAYGKKIFCYPWMNSRDVEHLREQMSKNIRTLIENECVVVLPTTKKENIMKVSTKYNIINLC